MNYEITYNKLIERIKSTRRKENILLLLNGLLLSLGVGLIITLVAVIIESIAFGDTTLRTFLAGSIFVSFVVALGIFAVPPLMRFFNIKNNPTVQELAKRIGKHFPEINDKLSNSLQLIPLSKNPKGMSPDLALAAFQSYYDTIENKDFDAIINKDNTKKNILFFIIPLILLIGSTTAFKNVFGDSLYRVANYNKSFLPPVPFQLKVTPEKTELNRDSRFKIEITITGKTPAQIWLSTKEEQQEKFDSFEIKPNVEGKYIYEISSIKNSFEYYAYSEWYNEQVQSNKGIVKVIEKPVIKSISGRLNYPSYTNLSSKYIDEKTADLTCLKGSNVHYDLLVNKKINKAQIVFINKKISDDTTTVDSQSDTNIIPLKITENRVSGSMSIRKTGIYYFEIIDENGYKNENPINYTVIAQNDNFPEISLIDPTSDIEINKNGLLSIKAQIADDYGFSTLKLYYKLVESPYTSPDINYTSININFDKKELNQEIPYIWDLNKLSIMPEDKFEFYLEVADNDNVSGPKKVKTQIIGVRLPSMREVQRDADLSQQQIQQELQKMLNETQELKKDIDELNRELLKDKEIKKQADWQDKKKAEELLKKQQDLKERLSDVQKKLEETTKNLQENNLMSQETLDRYMELQNLMKQVDSPELKMMQQKMQDALKNMSQDQMQKALENFKFNEEQFRQSIERTMKLLKKIQAEQKVDALQKRAEELAKQQEKLMEETEKVNPNDQNAKENLAQQQEKLQKELDNINNETKDLEKMLKEMEDQNKSLDDLNESKQALNKEETEQEMKSSQENMKKGNLNKSKQSQKKAAQNLKNFAQKMKDMKEKMKKQSNEETAQKMQKQLSDLLELSKNQEKIKNQTQNADYNSTSLPQFAQNQAQTFESLVGVAKAMSELSQKSFAVTPDMGKEMSNAMQKMREAIEQMADRNTSQAANSQSQAMSSLNKTVGQMQQMLDKLKQQNQGSCDNPGGSGGGEGEGEGQSSGSGMSFSQQIQQAASEQQAVNQALQKMMQGGSTGQGKEQLEKQAQEGRLADKQGAAQKTIEELAKEQKQFGGDTKKLDELNKIAKEMKEVMTEMRTKGATPQTLKKQERILSRLLDLQRSENERDFEKEREGNTANDLFSPSPAALNMDKTDSDKMFKDMLKNNQNGFSKDYENLIKTYFEKLRNN